jgi:HEAT repeat protein
MKTWMSLLVFAGLLSVAALVQGRQTASSTQAAPAAAVPDSDEEPDMPVAKPASSTGSTVEAQTNAAWDMLNNALSDKKTQAELPRIDAIGALGTLGDFPQAVGSLRDAEKDQDRYIRLAAVTAMASSKKTLFLPDLKQALNDSAAEVSFSAAVGLWKMDDKSGESVLEAVLEGDRKANRGLVSSEKHDANQDLHSPSKLAEIGAEQGAFALLGPFGFGLSAIRGRRGQNGIHPRVVAATLLAEDKSNASMKQFIDALDDSDPSVRAAAVRLLGDYHTKEVLDALSDEFSDAKPAVRLMAAASYIRAAHPQPESNRRKRATAISSTRQRSTTPSRVAQ